MTVFRLNAGKPTPYQRGRLSAREDEETLQRIRYYPPNTGHDDATLACGDTIPWPVIQAFGRHIHGQILCSEHGYQPKITKTEIKRIEREAKCHNTATCQPSLPDEPPF